MIFEMRHITKVYDNVVANDDVSIHLNQGEILAIVGENGAGKTTLMRILYGLRRPDEGELLVRGKPVRFHSPNDAMTAGISMVQQHFMLFESMTVAENIVFGAEPTRGPFMDKQKMLATVRELSETYKLQIDPKARVEDCSVGLRQRVEILRVLYQSAEIIVFDEPSAVLTPLEVDALLDTMRHLASLGKSIVLITHKLHEVMNVADRVYVMRAGKVVAERETRQTSIDELSFLMVGRHLQDEAIPAPHEAGTLLETRALCLRGENRMLLRDVALHVDAGEIVGIAGVSGNGQTELVQCIAGLLRCSSGEVFVGGQNVTGKSVAAVRAAGLSYVPEDRFVWGGAPDGTLYENALMGKHRLPAFSRRGFLNTRKARDYCDELIDAFEVKTPSSTLKLRELSGGNAQKMIVAREMRMDVPLMICCEPTRGLDVGAMQYIHARMLEKRAQGGGVLLVSSELSEIMKLSDRIYVMFNGQMAGEFRRGAMDDKALGLLMVGGGLTHE